MKKLWAIAWKEQIITFTDRNLMLIMFATPLLLATIIGFAFGGASGGTITLSGVSLAIVNQDQAVEMNGQTLAYGTQMIAILSGQSESVVADGVACAPVQQTNGVEQGGSLDELFTLSLLDDAEAARAGVADGRYRAALIIPADFSASLANLTNPNRTAQQAELQILVDEARPLEAGVVRGVTEAIVNVMIKGNVAIGASIGALMERAQADMAFGLRFLAVSNSFNPPSFACGFTSAYDLVRVNRLALDDVQAQSSFLQLLIWAGTAQATFFAFFTASFGLLSIYDERKAWTLQRILMSPTPRHYALLGKIIGTCISVFLQLVILMLGLTLVGSLGEGRFVFIWGHYPLHLLMTVIILTLMVSGLGAFTVGIARTPEQARIITPMINAFFAILGGAFGFQLPPSIAQFSPIYWGVDAFQKLAAGDPQVGLNWLVLLGFGLVTLLGGSLMFNRRVQL